MNRKNPTAFSALLFGALLAFAAQAQDPQKPAAGPAAAAAAAPAPSQEPDPRIIEGIVQCLAEGLPDGWQKTWFTINETGRSSKDATGTTRQFEADFFYATDPKDAKGKPYRPCGANRIVDGVIALNDYLQPSQRHWTGVTMTFMLDGTYGANYDYSVRKPAPAKAAPKAAAKKKQETKQ
jgi:hypothetical protein